MEHPAHRDGRGSGVSRRRLLLGGAAALGGIAAAPLAPPAAAAGVPASADSGTVGTARESCWGSTQAGVATPVQSFAAFVGMNLRGGMHRTDLVRLMKLLTDDIERLTQGEPALADGVPELAGVPARLTVTVGVGPGFVAAPGLGGTSIPHWLRPMPAFTVDDLQPQWSGGDLLLQICADDPVTVSHAQQVLVGDADEFARIAWIQQGFHRAVGTTAGGTAGRNLMGYIDGTVNPATGSADFDEVVWIGDGPAWLRGGTGMVLRRIRMDLDTWASVDRASKEQIMGRRLADGAPLTGDRESDTPDLDATDQSGLPTIPDFAHVRLAHARHRAERILRRPYNYQDGTADGRAEAGLLFAAYAADLDRQFLPIQRRLQDGDLLNVWTTPVGSAVFAILPGFESGGWLGEALLT